MARALGATARCQQAVGPHLAGAPAPRRLLEARLRVRRLRRHRDPRVRHRRVDGRLHQQRATPARGAVRAAQRAHRAVAARVSALRDAGSGDRLPAGGAALVGPLAQGRGHRSHGRADAARLDAGLRAAGAMDGRSARSLGDGGRLAVTYGPSPAGCAWTRTACCATPRPGRSRMPRRPPRTARKAAASASSAPSSAAPTPAPGAARASRATSRPTSGPRRASHSASPRPRSPSRSRSSVTRGSRSVSRATDRWPWSPPGWTTWRRTASPGSSPPRSSTSRT